MPPLPTELDPNKMLLPAPNKIGGNTPEQIQQTKTASNSQVERNCWQTNVEHGGTLDGLTEQVGQSIT